LKNQTKKVLDEMLKVFYERKDKVLLFSYSVKMLNILQRFIQEKLYKFVRLDGETKNSERQKLVNSFNENQEIFIFLISTK
jgi:SNF2 family DNA or RNA helicase